ncbi:MAG: quinone-dependent dihydroorotate dehydrogenase, partial [Betaproteobacteria bacterium AqS2]|nr:quinone-dependent dihydroorotate dehydrogenase [Betaproteobacteria bacterium AqS2]
MLGSLTRGLRALPPERAHELAMRALRLSPRIYAAEAIGAPATVMGLHFPNRIGLAAGFDKDGDHINSLAKLGFGFIEVGTITPQPQPGSPQPRLFRLPASKALINRMGFNSRGVEHAARRLAQQGGGFSGVLGCNIGCNRETDKAEAYKDYLHCLRRLYGLANYYVINISSPNTPGLRNMQKPVALNALLRALVSLRDELSEQHREKTPLLIKIDPEQSRDQIEAMAEIVQRTGLDGIVATNTTTRRGREVAA